jgi:6-phosphogluconolactonase
MRKNRHIFWTIAPLIAILLLTFYVADAAPRPPKGKYFIYVGTYTEEGSKSKGIYAYRFDPTTAEITAIGLVAETVNPSFLAVHPNGHFLYAVNEVSKYKDQSSGAISAFAIDRANGKLTLLNQVPSRGADPCYVTLDRTGKYVLIANYTGGSVAVFPLLEDGRLGEASASVQYQGHGTNPERQEGPHPHSIDSSPDNHFALVDDLGLDQVIAYRFDGAKGSLTPSPPVSIKVEPGAGPRHLAFHPSGKFAYVINEMQSTVTVFAYDAAGGALHSLQTTSTLPKDFTGHNDAAEVQLSPSGKFLYASNRGHDSIAVFAIDPRRGTLTPVEDIPTRGKIPRSFAIDPTGSFLLAANQKSDNVVVFRIDAGTGRLTPTGRMLEVAAPVCVTFLAIE